MKQGKAGLLLAAVAAGLSIQPAELTVQPSRYAEPQPTVKKGAGNRREKRKAARAARKANR